MENVCALQRLCLGRSYGAVGREFNVSESTMYIRYGVFRQKHRESKVMH